MLDTVYLELDRPPPFGAMHALAGLREHFDPNAGAISYSGKLENLRIRLTSSSVDVLGSLCTYALGSNALQNTRRDVEDALVKMSDALHMPMSEARVYRCDVAANLYMQRPVSEYLAACGEAERYTKNAYGRSGICYALKSRALNLYDKVKERQDKKQPVPSCLEGRHVLRYEVQLKNRVKTQTGQAVYGADLYELAFYLRLVARWRREYHRIRKKRQLVLVKPASWKAYQQHLALAGIEAHGGLEAALGELEDARARGVYKGKDRNYFRVRDGLRRLAKSERLTDEAEVVQELDAKIEAFARHARQV